MKDKKIITTEEQLRILSCAATCETIMETGIGEGDHICDVDPCLIVLAGYVPTDDYFWCDGAKWRES